MQRNIHYSQCFLKAKLFCKISCQYGISQGGKCLNKHHSFYMHAQKYLRYFDIIMYLSEIFRKLF